MPDFSWRAARPDGSLLDGHIQAVNREAALRDLRGRNLLPITLEDAGAFGGKTPAIVATRSRSRSPRAPGTDDIQRLTAELAMMLQAGLPLDHALKTMREMHTRPAVAAMLDCWLAAVKDGKGLSQALAAERPLFGDFYIGIVRAGEAGGQLARALEQLADHLERVRALRDGVLSALTYPAILLLVAAISVFLMLGFVVPQFESLFADMGEALPLATRVLVVSGNFVAAYWMVLLAVLLVALLAARQALATDAGRLWRDSRMLALPLLGDTVRGYETTRFARALGTLLANGVAIVGAIGIASETIGNRRLRAAIDTLPGAIKQGERVAAALARSGLFSPLALNMIRLGEETGRLDKMLLELARIQDREVETRVRRALTVLEPALILLLGGAIAAIMAAILLGILSVNELAI